MAKVCMFRREEKRTRVANRDLEKREALKNTIKNESTSFDERMAARDKLNNMDVNGAKIRQRNRCAFTGRPHGFHRKFGISRNLLREMASKGLLPGVKKASW